MTTLQEWPKLQSSSVFHSTSDFPKPKPSWILSISIPLTGHLLLLIDPYALSKPADI
jgi:hypothetical protein